MRYFLGVGAQKAGTTWLHEQLVRHPEIALSPRKEVHYFDTMYPTRSGQSHGVSLTRELRAAVSAGNFERAVGTADLLEVFFRGPEAYRRYLASNQTENTRVIGEITPSYADLTHAGFAAVRSTLDPLIVFVMRDPLDRYWSHVRQMGRHNWREKQRLAEAFQEAFLLPGVRSRSDYPALLRTLDDTFPPEQVLPLFYENLFDEAVLADIGRFLGVSPSWPWRIDVRANTGRSRPMPDPTPELLEFLEPIYSFVRQRFGAAVPDSWRL
jgi:hypothetical protein